MYAGDTPCAGEVVYAEGAVEYVLAAVEFEVAETELFLLAGDSEPRGSRRRLISMLFGNYSSRPGHALNGIV